MITGPIGAAAPVRGPGSGRRPRPAGPARRRPPLAARWPGGEHDPAGQARRLVAAASRVVDGPRLDEAQARAAITAARAVYAGYHHLALVLGPDGIPDAATIRGHAARAGARAVHGPGASSRQQRGLGRALERAGLLPEPIPGVGEDPEAA